MRLTLDKTEAARRQLEAAVQLWFHDGDPVAIHTLACAGSDLLCGVATHLHLDVKIGTEAFLETVRPEHRSDARALLKKSQNFFKHADRDAAATLDFGVEEAELRLLDACSGYRLIAPSPSPQLWAYETYAALTWAHHLLLESVSASFPPDLRVRISEMPRLAAFRELSAMLGQTCD